VALDFPASPIDGQVFGDYEYNTAIGAWKSTPTPIGGLPAGSIIQWSTNTAPANWLMANGALVSRATYASLYATIGTTYGVGDGSTTFALPDLRGRVAVGKDAGTFATLGAKAGAETVTLTQAQTPSHTHTYSGTSSSTGDHTHTYSIFYKLANDTVRGVNGDAIVGGQYSGTQGYYNGIPNGTTNASSIGNHAHTFSGTTSSIGSDAAHNNLQPYIVLNYIIKTSSGWTAGDSELATRVGFLETTVRPVSLGGTGVATGAGLVPVIPSSISVGSGSASVNALGTVAFSGVSNLTLNGVFTGNYLNYRAIIEIYSATATMELRAYYASLGTRNTTNYSQGGQVIPSNGGAIGTHSGENLTYFSFGYLVPATNYAQVFNTIDISNPATTSFSRHISSGVSHNGSATFSSYMDNGVHTVFSAFDGFSIGGSAGTISGNMSIYGYND
jgi:microcystin-dependent protein